jgi:hypothetical protein
VDIVVLNLDCTGPNPTCRRHHKAGRPVHVIPHYDPYTEPALVMSSYHYRTVEEGTTAIEQARETAPTVATDADLDAYRAADRPHFLPVGWVDPTRRRPQDWAAYYKRLPVNTRPAITCSCECSRGGFCGGCGHRGCAGR